jgi:hypothetical protein
VIKEARAREIRAELLNSEKLKVGDERRGEGGSVTHGG